MLTFKEQFGFFISVIKQVRMLRAVILKTFYFTQLIFEFYVYIDI